MSAPAWFTDDDVLRSAPLPAAIDAVERVLHHEAAGTAWNIAKTMADWPGGSAHSLGAVDLDDDLVVVKNWVRTTEGASSVGVAFAASDGRLRALLETGLLSMLRTAAVSGLATRFLADPAADELTVIGTGRQALWQVAAVHAVRPLRRVRVWSPTAVNREAFAARVRDELRLRADAPVTLEEAVAGAPIVTTITRAVEPFLAIEQLAPGALVNAVGAILPRTAELTPGVLAAADLVVVDSVENARRGSRELRERYGEDWPALPTLADVVAGTVTRPAAPRCVVVKAMGTGLCDLAVAGLVFAGVGVR